MKGSLKHPGYRLYLDQVEDILAACREKVLEAAAQYRAQVGEALAETEFELFRDLLN